jgi:hypothetical protein
MREAYSAQVSSRHFAFITFLQREVRTLERLARREEEVGGCGDVWVLVLAGTVSGLIVWSLDEMFDVKKPQYSLDIA